MYTISEITVTEKNHDGEATAKLPYTAPILSVLHIHDIAGGIVNLQEADDAAGGLIS